jgi:formate hydrogenlyase subunit 4
LWTSAGFTKPLRLALQALVRPRREASVVTSRGVVQAVSYQAEVPHLFDTVIYEPLTRAADAVGQPARVSHLHAVAARLAASARAGRSARMSAATVFAGAVQVGGGVLAAPLVVGAIQRLKARLQGRRGASVVQPYRELRRLWGKSGVAPEPHTVIYELAPAVVAASTALVLLLLPVGGRGADWGLGNDALVLVGLLALSRFAVTLAAWDTAGGFGLMGAARDLTFSVFIDGLLLLVLVLFALPLGSTDLLSMSHAATLPDVWSKPAHWAAALALFLVVVAETGRQPVDNPDTHLELTMVHEGPLLEYAGRDLAYLQWAAAARHWIMLVLACELVIPHPGSFAAQLAVLAGGIGVLCVALAACETVQAKMRILRVPLVLGSGMALCLLGVASWFAGGGG